MNQTRQCFTQDELIKILRQNIISSLDKACISDCKGVGISHIDCIMSALSMFSFKFPSILQFDKAKEENKTFFENLKRLFLLEDCPCDTYMRERLDLFDPKIFRASFCELFSILQRCKILENFRFFGEYYLVSVDGTGTFSSNTVHCDYCCAKNHQNGSVTYYHQLLTAALVHPDQKVVYPFAPEAIMNTDGNTKNDCECNAFKRWVQDFRREHPHLKVIIVADGLSSNEPFIRLLQEHRLHYILVCKETDHKYLTEWVAENEKNKSKLDTVTDGVKRHYEYIPNVPLNSANRDCLVNVVRFAETRTEKTKKGKQEEKTTKWMWVTNLPVNLENIEEFVKGGRSRWKIENETFNTLKNQGYNFEHNFGHGKKHLHTVFANLMLLAFFIDQCLQQVNKRFQDAVDKLRKIVLWQRMRSCLSLIEIPNFESLYHFFVHPPPPPAIPSVI